MFCEICGKRLGLFSSLLGNRSHSGCRQQQEVKRKAEVQAQLRKQEAEAEAFRVAALAQIREGRFKSLNGSSEMILDPGETLCVLIKGCWGTLFYPRAAGRVAPGQAIRVDGLKKVDFGSLHITDRRICFIGKGGAKTVALRKLLQCRAIGDTLHITGEGRSSSTYFILESAAALELARAAIEKLVALVKAGERPIILPEEPLPGSKAA